MKKAQAQKILSGLRKLYPKARCELDYTSPLELLVATILSAQCTDVRVNLVTKELFKRYKSASDFAESDPAELQSIIRSTGFYRNKAKSIREMSSVLVREHGGSVPDTMEELLKLRGVARKTANVVLGNAFGKASGVVVDTHMIRLSNRMGLTRQKDPVKIEKDLMACVPKKDWIYFSHAMIWHGRRVCKALSPDCPNCRLNKICPRRGV